MKIYTRTGDDGTTSLYGGVRLSKACVQVEAYGSLDELSCVLGMLILQIKENEGEVHFVEDIQRDLYIIMGFLAESPTSLKKQEEKIVLFEKKIDEIAKKLPPLTNFILPGGSPASCWAHMARVNCRKAERIIISHFKKKKIINKEVTIVFMYLNRLSDLLFTYARVFNNSKEVISKQ